MPPLLKEVLDPIKDNVSGLMSAGQMTEKDAKNIIFHLGMTDAIEKGRDPQELYNSYPQEVKDYFEYTPADLKRQQIITIVGLVVSVVGFMGFLGFGLRAAFIAMRAWRSGAGLFEIAKLTAVPAILAATFKQLIVNGQMVVNNLNDVFHWGPIFGQQNRRTLEKPPISIPTTWITNFGKFTEEKIDALLKHYQDNGVVGINNPIAQITYQLTKETLIKTIDDLIGQYNTEGFAPTPAEVVEDVAKFLIQVPSKAVRDRIITPSIQPAAPTTPTDLARFSESKTARPKLFLGTIFAGRVADVPNFIRAVDDAITSEEDLVLDSQINMTRWLAALPDWLNYKINIVLSPADEFGVMKIGTWAVLDIFYNKGGSKGLMLDRILLGPMLPNVYWPEFTKLQTIAFNLPKELTPKEIKPTMTPSGQFFSVDEKGNVITDFFAPTTRPVGVEPLKTAITPSPEVKKGEKITFAPPFVAAAPQFVPPAPTPAVPFGFTAPFVPPQPVAPTPTPAPTPALVPMPTPPTAAQKYQVNTPGSCLHLRTGARQSDPSIKCMPHGEIVEVTDSAMVSEGRRWLFLNTQYGGGFSAEEFLIKI